MFYKMSNVTSLIWRTLFAVVKVFVSLLVIVLVIGLFSSPLLTDSAENRFAWLIGWGIMGTLSAINSTYLIYSSIVEIRGIRMQSNKVVWIGFIVCLLTIILILFSGELQMMMTLGFLLLIVLSRDFFLLRRK
jgi:hypothetical protein